jgi:hypothetical protein
MTKLLTTAAMLVTITTANAASGPDMLFVVLQDDAGAKSVHTQTSQDCSIILKALKLSQKRKIPMTLAFEDPPAQGKSLKPTA